ncbi:hypothetical protein BDV11DRAFT_179369 [Aspergillus similis]
MSEGSVSTRELSARLRPVELCLHDRQCAASLSLQLSGVPSALFICTLHRHSPSALSICNFLLHSPFAIRPAICHLPCMVIVVCNLQ